MVHPALRVLAVLLCSGHPLAEYLSPSQTNIFTSTILKKHIKTHTGSIHEDEAGYNTCAFKNVSNSDSWFKVIQTDYVDVTNIYHEGGKSFIKKCRFCYALWTQSENTNQIIGQGCWFSGNDCHTDCQTTTFRNFKKNQKEEAKFCCCKGNKCNINPIQNNNNNNNKVNKLEKELTTATGVQVSSFGDNTKRISIISILSVLLIAISVVILMFSSLRKSHKKPWPHSLEDGLVLLEPSPDKPTYSLANLIHPASDTPPPSLTNLTHLLTPPQYLTNLKIDQRVRRGHYGSVHKATLGESTLAVKVFRSKNRDYFLNEKDIYTLPHMKHPGIVQFLGAQEYTNIGGEGKDLMLLFSWAKNGSLQQYLTKNTVSWNTFCQMAQSLLEGLVHLHSTINKNGKFKPRISHRDFNSGNILVKSDLSCCICDMGFAMKLRDSSNDGAPSLGSGKGSGTLFGAGSIRYMAPEELDGTLNMKSWEQALMQVDIYALGLVLWELSKRCHDLYQDSEVPAYEQAFENEVGLRPCCDEMQNLVSRKKVRPLFPEVWKVSNPAMKLLRDTIEECWDPEPTARLSSQCVLERICQLPARFKWTTNLEQKIVDQEKSFDNLTNTFSNKSRAGIVTFYKNPKPDSRNLSYEKLDSSNGISEDTSDDTKVKMNNNVIKQQASEHIPSKHGVNPYMEKNMTINPIKSKELTAKSTKEELNSDLNKLLNCLMMNGHVNLNNVRNQYCSVPKSSSPSITNFQNSVKSVKNTNLISDHKNQTTIFESSEISKGWWSGPWKSSSGSPKSWWLALLHMHRMNPEISIHSLNQTITNKNGAESKSNLVRAIKLTENLRKHEENLRRNENKFLTESTDLLLDVA